MLDPPAFAPHYQVEVVEGESTALVLRTERQATAIHGALYARLARLIDGIETADNIVDRLSEDFDPAHVYHALGVLERRGYVAAADRERGDGERAAALTSRIASPRLAGMRLALELHGDVSRSAVEARLGAHGAVVSDEAEVTVVAVDDYLTDALDAAHTVARARGRPWLLMRPVGELVWIGPLFEPGRPGCWRCLAHRLRRHRPRHPATTVVRAATRSLDAHALTLAVDRAVAELVRWRGSGCVEPVVVTLDPATGSEWRHPLTARPQCPGCGEPARYARGETGAMLTRSLAGPPRESGQAAIERDVADLTRVLVSPITGIVDRLLPIDDAANGPMRVYLAGAGARPEAARRAAGPWSGRLQACGAGWTGEAARAAALAEAVERYAGTFEGDEPRVEAALDELEGAIHPNACMLFSERQYRTRDAWNGDAAPADRVPVPFERGQRIDWTPVWSVTRRATRYLPTAYLYHDYPVDPDRPVCITDSSGCAAGRTIAGAALCGLLELVERDSVALWWYRRAPRRAIDLESLDDAHYRELSDHYRAMGREYWVLDVTSDLAIPACVAVTRCTSGSERVLLGCAADLDPHAAVARAVQEMHQMVVTLATVLDTGLVAPELAKWLTEGRVTDERFLAPSAAAAIEIDAPAVRLTGDVADFDRARHAVERCGLEVLVLDQSRPDVGLPVVRVIAPGLRHLRPRFAPGRLFDAPVAAGGLCDTNDESQLNPRPFPL